MKRYSFRVQSIHYYHYILLTEIWVTTSSVQLTLLHFKEWWT